MKEQIVNELPATAPTSTTEDDKTGYLIIVVCRGVVPDGPEIIDPNVRAVVDPNTRAFIDPNFRTVVKPKI